MARDKKSFVVYTSWNSFLEDLSNEQLGIWFRWVLDYCNDKNPEYPEEQAIRMACKMTQDILKEDLQKWKEVKQTRAEAGKLGGLAKASKCYQKLANASKSKQSLANVAVNVNDNVNVNVNDNVNVNVEDKSSLFIKESTEGAKEKSERFSKPSIEEIEKYIEEQHYSVNAEKFYSYYESNGWKIGKSSMKSWKAALRTWNLNNKEQNKSNSNDLNKKSIEELMKMDINKGTTIL